MSRSRAAQGQGPSIPDCWRDSAADGYHAPIQSRWLLMTADGYGDYDDDDQVGMTTRPEEWTHG